MLKTDVNKNNSNINKTNNKQTKVRNLPQQYKTVNHVFIFITNDWMQFGFFYLKANI